MIGSKQEQPKGSLGIGKQRSYSEVVELLDSKWKVEADKTLSRMKKLDAALGSPSKKLNTILVAGTNGKSLTINFASQIFKEEGIKSGSFYSPHFLTYNERISLNKSEIIQNKQFTELANEVINTTEAEGINASTRELLTAMAFKYFELSEVEVAILEIENSCSWDPVNICNPKVVAITRITDNEEKDDIGKIPALIDQMTAIAQKDSWVISADQSKISLQQMQDRVLDLGAKWAMPIRKLAPLPYPFEQLHGRCAALAERAAQIFAEEWIANNEEEVISDSLLIKPKGQRGRPTIEAKRQSELNPRRTLEQFWKDTYTMLPGHFQLMDKEKPTMLLDNSNNLDSLANLLLGARLLNYQKPFKGLVLIYNYENNTVETPEFLRLVRYFFKKTAGQIIISPAVQCAWKDSVEVNTEKIVNNLKNAKLKASSANNFAEAFAKAKKLVDERNGLVIVAGGSSAISEYWSAKGIKKL